jgi:hypothetical protein
MEENDTRVFTCQDCVKFRADTKHTPEGMVTKTRCTVTGVKVTPYHIACYLFFAFNPDKCEHLATSPH